jgi:UDP-glucose:(heptosyl)LPS alpha-1,3-glucosyltransferase
MKLALVLFDYYSFGGLQRGCFMVAEEAERRGHEVKIFAGMWKGDHPKGVAVEVLGNDGWSNVSRNKFFFHRWQARRQGERFDGVIGFNKMPGLDIYYGSDSCYAARLKRLQPTWYRWTPRYRHFRAW